MTKFKNAKAFARHLLSNGSLPLTINPALMKTVHGSHTEVVVYREGQTQVEFVYIFPNISVPNHCHPDVDAAELWIGGIDGEGFINGKLMEKYFDNKNLLRNFSSLPKGTYHGGNTGNDGVMYISFQLWHGISPSFLSDNWSA